jgi:hypothetical protein
MSCDCSDSSSNSSTNTMDIIKEMCNDCDHQRRCDCNNQRDVTYISRYCHETLPAKCEPNIRDNCHSSTPRYNPGVSYFTSVITPLSGLSGFSGIKGSVEFKMRRKNKTITLQWEPFTGALASNGITYLTVAQNISNTPPYVVSFPIYLTYKGTGRITRIEIDPFVKTGNIKFYLNTDGSGTNINTGDNISVAGGAVTWIVN